MSKIHLSGLFTHNTLITFHQIFLQRERQVSLPAKLASICYVMFAGSSEEGITQFILVGLT